MKKLTMILILCAALLICAGCEAKVYIDKGEEAESEFTFAPWETTQEGTATSGEETDPTGEVTEPSVVQVASTLAVSS